MLCGYILTKNRSLRKEERSMTIGDLLFFLTVLIIVGALVFVPLALLRHRSRPARLVSLLVFFWIAGYLIAVLAVSLLTPQSILRPHQEHCFDDMCFSVVSASVRKTLAASPAQLTAQ